MIKLINIPKELIDNVWVQVEPDIKSALDRSGNYANPDHFNEWLNKGLAQLWILWDEEAEKPNKYHGVVVTEVINRPLIKICNIRIMVGKGRENWQHYISIIEDFAKKNGCDKMELIARPGWERVLKQFNYTKSHVVLDKYLKE
jgi:hypothetical protein